MSTFYQICVILVGGAAVAFVALYGMNKMGLVHLDPIVITQNIIYSIRH